VLGLSFITEGAIPFAARDPFRVIPSLVAGSVLGAAQTPSWLAQPAAWTVPAAFAVTILVSRATRGRVPRTMTRLMTRLHTPERPLATER